MRIVLDVTRLVDEGKLTAAEAERLKALAMRDTGTLAINVMLSFGALAVATGILALFPTFATGAALGVMLIAIGLLVSFRFAEQWGIAGTATVIIGALSLSGGVAVLLDGHVAGFIFAAALWLALGLAIRSGLLVALVPVALAGALGSTTGYFHASYTVLISEPTVTVVVFAALACAAYLVARRVRPSYEGLALVFARVSLVFVNFGFWVGSLWGDYPGASWWVDNVGDSGRTREAWHAMAPHVPDLAFIVVWAAALVGAGLWAARADRRWVVSAAATFGAIHFYTQWFERLGADPLTVIGGGLMAVGVAIALWRYNRAAAVAVG